MRFAVARHGALGRGSADNVFEVEDFRERTLAFIDE
jgi:hypothetical protein